MDNKIIIAIDGLSGCGKSSTAKAASKKLNYTYIDSGAMYRAVTLYFLNNDIKEEDKAAIESVLQNIHITFKYNKEKDRNETYLNDEMVEDDIRTMKVSDNVSWVSAISAVRKKMVEQQQKLSIGKGVIMDGRDIGTVVFPNADLKIFMTADTEVRALRRKLELKEKGIEVSLREVIENLKKRDEIDSNREDSPLKKAKDAIELNTTHLNFDQQVENVVNLAKNKIEERFAS